MGSYVQRIKQLNKLEGKRTQLPVYLFAGLWTRDGIPQEHFWLYVLRNPTASSGPAEYLLDTPFSPFFTMISVNTVNSPHTCLKNNIKRQVFIEINKTAVQCRT